MTDPTPTQKKRTRGPTTPETKFTRALTTVRRWTQEERDTLADAVGRGETSAKVKLQIAASKRALRELVVERETGIDALEETADMLAIVDGLPPDLRGLLVKALESEETSNE